MEDWLYGSMRPEWVVENPAEIIAEFARQGMRPKIECGWCGTRCQPRSIETATRWFNSHACDVDELAARRNLHLIQAWDLGALPPEHPFSAAA